MEIEDKVFQLIVHRLTGELTNKQQSELAAWLKDEANLQEYQRIERLWNESAEVNYLSLAAKLKDWEEVRNQFTDQKSYRVHWIAASVVFIICAVLIVRLITDPFRNYSVYQATDSVKELVLEDQSRITLNKNSKLYISDDFNQSNRNIILAGEAFFEVARNEDLPFEVESGSSITKVLGTAFNLLTTDEGTELTVTEGSVEFGDENKKLIMKMDQAAFMSQSGDLSKKTVTTNVLSWKTGVLSFEDQLLSSVASDISKHFSVSIEFSENDLKELSFTSHFENASLTEVLQELRLVLALEITQKNKTYLIKRLK